MEGKIKKILCFVLISGGGILFLSLGIKGLQRDFDFPGIFLVREYLEPENALSIGIFLLALCFLTLLESILKKKTVLSIGLGIGFFLLVIGLWFMNSYPEIWVGFFAPGIFLFLINFIKLLKNKYPVPLLYKDLGIKVFILFLAGILFLYFIFIIYNIYNAHYYQFNQERVEDKVVSEEITKEREVPTLSNFLYKDEPVHPFCVYITAVRSGGTVGPLGKLDIDKCYSEFNLSEFTDIKEEDGFYIVKGAGDDFFSRGTYYRYKIWARVDNDFLIYFGFSGGGSGHFTTVEWIRRENDTLYSLESLDVGGDRCWGGLWPDANQEGDYVYFSTNTTAEMVIDLIKPEKKVNFGSSYSTGCFGSAHYRYNILTKEMEFLFLEYELGEGDDWLRNCDRAIPICCLGNIFKAKHKENNIYEDTILRLSRTELEEAVTKFFKECDWEDYRN